MMNKKELLLQTENNVKVCKKCRLCDLANNAVPGEGNIDSEVVFIGEAPGAEEDKQGRPFVGRAGKLLEAMLNEIGYKREDVWIGNIIKHRPPENRDPLPDEVSACSPYLTLQLNVIKPKMIVTLGRYAMYYFDKDGKISRDRGIGKMIGENFIFPVYHPAAALRNPSMMRDFRSDFLKIPSVLSSLKTPTNSSQNLAGSVDGQIGLEI